MSYLPPALAADLTASRVADIRAAGRSARGASSPRTASRRRATSDLRSGGARSLVRAWAAHRSASAA